jgi:hypothetical protein
MKKGLKSTLSAYVISAAAKVPHLCIERVQYLPTITLLLLVRSVLSHLPHFHHITHSHN